MILWILTLAVGISAFGFGYNILNLPVAYAFGYSVGAMLITRGLLAIARRWLILHEKITPVNEDRTVATNRAIFWKRAIFLALLPVGYFAVAFFMFSLTPPEALAALPSFAATAAVQLLYVLFLLMANFLLFLGPFYLYTRIGKTMINPDDANFGVKIADVRGQTAAVEEMNKVLDLIEHGRNFVKAGGKRERGVLMVGPPGTGKTMLAKAIASSLGVPIYIANGGSFAGMFMGIDALSVYLMVRAAKKKAKVWGGCLVFIDEIDALGMKRQGTGGAGSMGGMMGFGGMQLGLNMLLVLMDGIDNPGMLLRQGRALVNLTLDGLFIPRRVGRVAFRIPALKAPSYNILFIGATNRPSVMDEALTRPGRFGRQLVFRNPNREARKDIAALYFDKKAHVDELDTDDRRTEFARVTEGYSPADIEQVLSLALLYAFNEGRTAFEWADIRQAMGNVEAGLPIPVEYTEREARLIARHEMGHAVTSHFFQGETHEHARLSIRRRSGAQGEIGGYHSAMPKEETFTQLRSEMATHIRHALGSIAAEHVFYGENSNGVFGDLSSATSLATRMVGVVGMGGERGLSVGEAELAEKIGTNIISIADVAGSLQGSWQGTVLGDTASRKVVAQVLGWAYIEDWRLINVNKDAFDKACDSLVANKELMGSEVTDLLDAVGLRAPNDGDAYPDAEAW